jgi:hypothetical protein
VPRLGPKDRHLVATAVRPWKVKQEWSSAEGAALNAIHSVKKCRPYGPRLQFVTLIHGLTAVAIECRAFGAVGTSRITEDRSVKYINAFGRGLG